MKTKTLTLRTQVSAAVLLALCFSFLMMMAPRTFGARAGRAQAAIWVDGRLYDVVLTDTDFKPPPDQATDLIFNFMDSGLSGQRSVAEAAPGDPDYNGGRWTVMAVSFTDAGRLRFDPDGDGMVNLELMNAEAVLQSAAAGLVIIEETGVYFECPLLPRRTGP